MSQKKTLNNAELVIPQVIVGLGNPEPKYDKTRHNIGFAAVDTLAENWQLSWQENRRFQGLFAEGTYRQRKIRLLKPLTYMNRSGQSLRAVLDWYKITPESVLVIYDDMDLPLGKLRLRLSGSAGGHNGMRSIISHLNTQEFPRARLGIGKSNGKKETISHVLGKFSAAESTAVQQILELTRDAIELSLTRGLAKAMSLYNNRTIEIENSLKN
ncbi:MAG: aminoacyl-tRNA hydrolase [Prochloraceae cyanobacterium]